MRKVTVLVCMMAAMALCFYGAASADQIGNCIHDYGGYRTTEQRTEDDYTYLSPDAHTHYSETFTMLTCSQCGDLKKQDIIAAETTEEPHRYDENGYCACGAYCPHEGVEDAERYSRVTEARWTKKDATHHVMATMRETFAICPVCGEEYIFSSEIETEVPDTTEECQFDPNNYGYCSVCGNLCEHEYAEGICTKCQYVCKHPYYTAFGICHECGISCAHTNKVTITDEGPTVEYEWISAEKHAIVTMCKQHDECPTCLYHSTQRQNAERIEENHTDADENGICDICGYLIETGMENNWTWNYTTGQGHVLTITGSGRIPDYESAEDVPWAEHRSWIDQMVISSGITYIGKNAFAGMNQTVRVNFLEAYKPTIHADAFRDTTTVFRHYYNNDSWPADGTEEDNRWIYLPFYRDDLDEFSTVVYYPEGWTVRDYNYGNTTDILLDNIEQAMELSWRGRNIDLEQLPSENDWEMLEDNLSKVSSITFFSGCKGTLAFSYSQENAQIDLEIAAPELNLTVTDTNTDSEYEGMYRLVMEGGNVTYNGSIQTLILRSAFSDSTGCNLTVNGSVDEVDFYGKLNEQNYKGSLTVNGTIKEGFEYGNVSMAVPNIEAPIVFNDMVLAKFGDTEQTDPVIINGVLNVNGVTPISNLTYDMFKLNYMLVSDGWHLELNQKEGAETGNLYGAPSAYLPDFKPDFSVDDIYWSEDTIIHIWNPGGQGKVVLNGPTENGVALPINLIWIEGGNVELNCKVESLILLRRYTKDEPCIVTINGPVTNCYMTLYKKTGNRVTVGENGSIINGGNWERTLNDERYYGPVAAGTDLLEGGQMKVMSWRWGEEIQALMPSDNEMQIATGEYSADIMMDVGESSMEELTEDESDALTAYLAGNSIEAEDVVSVFDATVTAYNTDENGQVTDQWEISELNRPVRVVVNNPTGEDCFIARIHEDADDTTVEAVSKKATATTIPFVSDLFSKYVIIKGNAPYNPTPVEWNYSEGAWLNTLTITGDGELEDYSAEHPAPWAAYADTIDLITIGEGITGIGANAFAGMGRMVRVDFLGETMPEIDAAAFTGTNAVCRYYTEGTAEKPWPTGTTENGTGFSLRWIYLPAYIEDGMDGVIRRVEYTANGQWGISVFNTRTMGRDLIPMSVEQIKEATFGKLKDLLLWGMPNHEDIDELWENVDQLAIETPCEGSLAVNLEADDGLSIVQIGSENATVTITDPRANGVEKLICCNGSLTYDGNVQQLNLRESMAGENEYLVTVTGNVQEMQFHGPGAGSPYTGSVKVNGTVVKGIVRERNTLVIPGSEDPIVFDDMITASFENANPTDHMIIRNGVLQVAATEKNVSLDMFNLRYYFGARDGETHISLGLTPKAEFEPVIGSDMCFCSDLNITPSQIYYGNDTDITIQTTDDEAGTVVLGIEDETTHEWSGSLHQINLFYGRVICNGTVHTVGMYNNGDAGTGSTLIINGSVGDLSISDLQTGSVSLGTGGSIGEGMWIRSNGEWRNFGTVRYSDTENGTLYTDRTLRAMSWKNGQQIRAKMPSEDDLKTAAGLTGDQRAMADVSDSSAAELSIDESAALNRFLGEHEGAVAAIFDATITAYTEDAEGKFIPGDAITNLNSAVQFKVGNTTGDECYIVRLHDEGDGMTATQLTAASDATEIPFSSNLFSKYAIIAKNWTAVEEWTGWTFGEVGTGIDREWVLHITGSGEMPDYSSPVQMPWYAEAAGHENIRIVIDESVTKIGNNAFGGLEGTVRVDFRGETMPTVSSTAFSGTTARCRYYYENESWTAGINGRNDAKWIYLPVYEEDTPGRWPINFGYPNTGTSTLSWYLQNSQGNIPLTTEQAEELSYKCRELNFDIMPRMSDTKLYDTGNVPWHATFGAGCDGEYNLNASNGANTLERLDIYAPKMKLTINRSTADKPMEFAEIKSGTVGITGDVAILSLRNSNDATACSVTITGDVGEMDFYNASTGYNVYSGNAVIIGTIGQGYEYGNGTMDIPGIGNSVPLNSFVAKRFSDLARTAAEGLLIDHGVLTLQSGEYEAGGSTDIKDYRLEYQFIDDTMDEYDRTVLTLTPKGGGQGIDIDILEQKPTFSPADIIWGNDTDIHIGCWDPRTPKSITLGNGGEGQGFNSLFINSTCGTINLNCPVNQLEVYQNINSTNTLELNINSKVENTATLSLRGNGNTVKLGENGWLAGGIQYMKPLTSTRELPAIRGKHDPLIADGRLTVLSSKAGESLESILPGDSALATAARMTAVMDIGESTEPLSGDELEKLEESLQIGNDEVVEVFNVTVTGYDAEENPMQLDKLNGGAVQMAIKNTTGEEVYVARLHEENGQMTATAVSETTAGDVVWFASDLFSKYVLVKPEKTIDPSTLLTLRLPDSLTRIEEYAFAGGIFEAVIIPDGCIYIGEHAFENCGELVYISYPASYESGGIEIKESAFDGCGKIKVAIRDNDAGQ